VLHWWNLLGRSYNSVLVDAEADMKTGFLVASLLLLSSGSLAQQKDELGLPELNVVKTAVLTPSYSCRSASAFRQGYAGTALFLSESSRETNSPELLFNGACKSEDFEGMLAGDGMSLVADLGDVPLAEVSSSRAFNFKRIHSFELYSRFAQAARVEAHHTYAVLINTRDLRGLFVFRVEDYKPNSSVVLSYAVKDYQVLAVRGASKGFDWSAENRPTSVRFQW
jgi:hypothetical protein